MVVPISSKRQILASCLRGSSVRRTEISYCCAQIDMISRFLFNPFTLLACLGRSTNVFTTFFVLLSINHACQAKTTTAAFALAIASYLSLHPAFLLPPLGLLCYDRICQQISGPSSSESQAASKVAADRRNLPSPTVYALQIGGTFALACALLLGLSRILLPSWTFIPSVYLTHLQLPDLTPNAGLWWYFFIEMFDPFRSFFLGVFWLHMLSYSVPLCLRLKKQPLAATVLMMGIIAIFEPYASIGDVGAWLSALCLLGHSFERTFSSDSAKDSGYLHTDIVQSPLSIDTPSPPLQHCSTPPSLAQPSTTSGSTPDPAMPTSSTPSRSCGIWLCWFCSPIRCMRC